MLMLYADQCTSRKLTDSPAHLPDESFSWQMYTYPQISPRYPQIGVASPVAAFVCCSARLLVSPRLLLAFWRGCRPLLVLVSSTSVDENDLRSPFRLTTELFNMQKVLIVALLALTCGRLCQGIERDQNFVAHDCTNQICVHIHMTPRLSVQVRQPRLSSLHRARS
jgi:hypothetical protein